MAQAECSGLGQSLRHCPPSWCAHQALSSARVADPILSWLRDYLSNRTQSVVLEGQSSSPCNVTLGVPQGSILGPLLFILAFYSIFHLPLSSGRSMTEYADNATYSKRLASDQDVEDMNVDLKTISDWISGSGCRLNLGKAKVMVISLKKSPPHPTVLLCCAGVEHTNSYKLLGVTVTSNLSWATHILQISSKAEKHLLGFLQRVFKDAGRGCLATLYKSVVLPHLDYCCSV